MAKVPDILVWRWDFCQRMEVITMLYKKYYNFEQKHHILKRKQSTQVPPIHHLEKEILQNPQSYPMIGWNAFLRIGHQVGSEVTFLFCRWDKLLYDRYIIKQDIGIVIKGQIVLKSRYLDNFAFVAIM